MSTDTVKVTLTNHSKTSGFKAVIPSHSFSKQFERYNPPKKRERFSPDSSVVSDENLLTSERTHFRPIKQTYTDGYTFEISNELEDVKYHRSASGTLYLDSDVYREYYLYEDDMGDNLGRIANSGRRNNYSGDDYENTTEKTNTTFVLKYCVKQNEKSCQTEDVPPIPQCNAKMAVNTTLSNNSNSNSSRHQHAGGNNNNNVKNINSSLGSSDVDMENEMVCFGKNGGGGANRPCNHDDGSFNNDKSMMDDIMDGSYLLNIDGWTLAENRKRCHNNNNTHALWEHCAACTNDVISLPANRLLKDELSADGDEIMSDLKYMQNLYIGSDWEDDDCEEDEDYDGLLQPLENSSTMGFGMVDDDDDGYNDEQANHIYLHVSKLISDLLQPERAKTLVKAISEKCNGSAARFGHTSEVVHGTNSTNGSAQQTQTVFGPGLNRIVSRNDNDLLYGGENNNNNNNNSNNNNNHVNYFGELWSNNNYLLNPWRCKETTSANSASNDLIWSNYVPPADDNNKVEKDEPIERGSSSLLSLSSFSTKPADHWEHANLEKLWIHQSDDEPTDAIPLVKCDNDALSNMPNAHHQHENAKINQPSTSQQQQQQSYSISNNDHQALQKFIDLANQQSKFSSNPSSPLIKLRSQQHNLQQHQQSQTDHSSVSMDSVAAIRRRNDRKRRHSATSQNVLEQFNFALANYNSERRKLTATHYDHNNMATNDLSATTIITCKYWATDSLYLASTLASLHGQQYQQQQQQQRSQHNAYHPHNINGTITMHPTTILKHVAEMVARPLTR